MMNKLRAKLFDWPHSSGHPGFNSATLKTIFIFLDMCFLFGRTRCSLPLISSTMSLSRAGCRTGRAAGWPEPTSCTAEPAANTSRSCPTRGSTLTGTTERRTVRQSWDKHAETADTTYSYTHIRNVLGPSSANLGQTPWKKCCFFVHVQWIHPKIYRVLPLSHCAPFQ